MPKLIKKLPKIRPLELHVFLNIESRVLIHNSFLIITLKNWTCLKIILTIHLISTRKQITKRKKSSHRSITF